MTNNLISEVKNVYFVSGKLPKWFVHCITRSNVVNFGNENFAAFSKFNQIVALMLIRPSLNVLHGSLGIIQKILCFPLPDRVYFAYIYNERNDVSTLVSSFLDGSSSFLQVTKTTIKLG